MAPVVGRRSRLVKFCMLTAAALALTVLPDLGFKQAEAHNWGSWHWDRGGSQINMYIWDQTGGCGNGGTATNDALYDIYYNPHPIWVYCVGSHTDISLWEQYEPGAWYCGLAEVWSPWYGGSHIDHGHARMNTACTSGSGLSGKFFKQGVECQEVTHTLGFDHSDVGDCMGLSYYGGSNGRYYYGVGGPYRYDWDHQSADIYYRYRYH
jgi:hypothetical protein